MNTEEDGYVLMIYLRKGLEQIGLIAGKEGVESIPFHLKDSVYEELGIKKCQAATLQWANKRGNHAEALKLRIFEVPMEAVGLDFEADFFNAWYSKRYLNNNMPYRDFLFRVALKKDQPEIDRLLAYLEGQCKLS